MKPIEQIVEEIKTSIIADKKFLKRGMFQTKLDGYIARVN